MPEPIDLLGGEYQLFVDHADPGAVIGHVHHNGIPARHDPPPAAGTREGSSKSVRPMPEYMLDTETVSLAPQGQGRVASRLLEPGVRCEQYAPICPGLARKRKGETPSG